MSFALITFGNIEGFFGRGISMKSFSRCKTCSNRVAGVKKFDGVNPAMYRVFGKFQCFDAVENITSQLIRIQFIDWFIFHNIQQLYKFVDICPDRIGAICFQFQGFNKSLKCRLIYIRNLCYNLFSGK